MGYSKEFVELTNVDLLPTFEIKDVSDKLGPGKHSDNITMDVDIVCEGFKTSKYFKTEDGKLICIENDGNEINFLDLLVKYKPKEAWD